mmetsp:Transcript_41169/g.126868  ORF Transcript_41169/g.126868 Transcript_41169/m.126868 type:complete len:243 (+) Transcript_41169:88-816(+)
MAARRRSEASGSPSGRARAERMASLSSSSGKPHATAMSIRPGRRSAGSMSSGREEAASTNTAPRASTPSRWQRRVLTTRSVTPVESQPRARPSASNSSKKRRHGAAALAFANVSRTFASDAPMYLSSSSGPETLMKGRPNKRNSRRPWQKEVGRADGQEEGGGRSQQRPATAPLPATSCRSREGRAAVRPTGAGGARPRRRRGGGAAAAPPASAPPWPQPCRPPLGSQAAPLPPGEAAAPAA